MLGGHHIHDRMAVGFTSHNITEILLKVALNTIKPNQTKQISNSDHILLEESLNQTNQ